MPELIPGMNLPEFLARRDQVLDSYQRAFAALLEADEQAKQAGIDDFPTFEGYSAGEGRLWEHVGRALRRVDRNNRVGHFNEPPQVRSPSSHDERHHPRR